MADVEKPNPEGVGNGLSADSGAVVPRLNLAEVGFVGLRMTNKQILEEANRQFRYPSFIKTVNEMRNDPTVAAALNVFRMMISRVSWSVKVANDASEQDKKRAKFIASCMDDMEGTWGQFISEVITYLEFGFSVQEKVFRRRLKRNGSKYNDGLVGLKKIAPRGQDTIRHWNFSEDGRELLSVGQSLVNLENGYRYQSFASNTTGLLTINRDKFLLFSADSIKGNPEGKSILKSVYLPYKQLTLIKDQLMLGVAKDLAAIPIVTLPAKLMDVNASTADKAAYSAYQSLVNNVAAGTQRGVVFPSDCDPETKLPYYSFQLLEAKGQSKFNLPEIIKQLQNDILVALSADVITMGSDVNGSFSIKDTKTNLCAMAVEHRLNEIKEVLNADLIPQIYALNGWNQEVLPTFEYGDIADVDSEAFSKLIQRVASVGLLEIDRALLNKIREVVGVETLSEETPVNRENLTGAESRSGDGMETGTSGDGTAKIGGKASKVDRSAANADNKG